MGPTQVHLTPAPWASGTISRDQRITKTDRGEVRALMIQLAWCWVRYQPESALTRWFKERFGAAGRSRKVGIVAVARRLAVAFWRYLDKDQVPDGATLEPLRRLAAC